MKKLILMSTIIVLSSTGCGVQKKLVQKKEEVYQIVNLQSDFLSRHQLYYKSYVVEKSMFAFPDEYFKCMFNNPSYELARKETDSITALDIPDHRKKKLIKKVEEKYIADLVPNIIPQEEIKWMRRNLISKPLKWNQNLVRNKMTRNPDYNSVRFSVPVFNADEDHAIMFLKFDNSIEARIYKKVDGIWTYYCYYLLSSSD